MTKLADFEDEGSVPVAFSPEERERIGGEIERLIALLDTAEAEPNNDTEPDLGWPVRASASRTYVIGLRRRDGPRTVSYSFY
jgi:hypothetical protein